MYFGYNLLTPYSIVNDQVQLNTRVNFKIKDQEHAAKSNSNSK